MYWVRGLALDMTGERVVCVVCKVGTFKGCEDNVNSENITKGETMKTAE